MKKNLMRIRTNTKPVVLTLLAIVASMMLHVLPAWSIAVVSDFYVPMPESQMRATLAALQSQTNQTIDSVISIVVSAPGAVIHYDHHEDGYEPDIANPVQPSTEIWGDGNNGNGVPPGFANDPSGMAKGAVIALRNLVPLPRNTNNILYDGGDRVVSGKALVMTRAGWATDPGTVLAGAIEVTPVKDFGTSFICPVGQDVSANNMFELVSLLVMAKETNTALTVDVDGAGAAPPVNVVLGQGQSYHLLNGILKGATISASKPVQAHLITGDINASYESRWYTLYPFEQWGDSYITPVGTATNGQECYVFVYNPNPASIQIDYTTKIGSGNFSVGAGAAFQWEVPQLSGAKLASAGNEIFFALATAGADPNENRTYDWGFTLVPENALTSQAVVGWGPGSSDLSQNGSPVWVSPVGPTRVYVDYKGDGLGPLTDSNGDNYDVHYDLVTLESKTVYDPSNDQTGMRLYTLDLTAFAAAWGQDPSTAGASNPYLDMGTTVLPVPSLSLTKTPQQTQYTAAGDVLTYTFLIENTGGTALTNISVSDPVAAVSGSPIAFLAPGASDSATFTASYIVTQADVEAGSFTNVATVTGTTPFNEILTSTAEATVQAVQVPSITLTKTAITLSYDAVGDVIQYTIAVENTGNVYISAVGVSDPAATSGPTYLSGDSDNDNILDVGEIWLYEAEYTVAQNDLDNGAFTNTATVTGEDPNGDPVMDQDDVTVNATQNAQLSIVKAPVQANYDDVGDILNYTFTVTNTGNVTLTNVVVTDPQAVVVGIPIPALAPGASNNVAFTATHVITQADIDAGQFQNTATVTGNYTDANNTAQQATASDDATVPAVLEPFLNVTKTGIPAVYSAVGQVIQYTIAVQNSGNVTIYNLLVTDPSVTSGPGYLSGDINNDSELDPGETWLFGASYTVTQADIDAGSFLNTATAAGNMANLTPISGQDSETVTALQDPSIAVSKTAQPLTYAQAGDVITYSITVENTGNVTLSNLVVADPQATSGPTYDAGDDGDNLLEPGETWSYTATYVVTQADLQNGTFTNVVTATGKDPQNGDVPGSDSETVTAIRADLAVLKTGQPDPVLAGQMLTYTITIENLGTDEAENVALVDVVNPLELTNVEFSVDSGASWAPWTSPYGVGNLPVGASVELLLRGVTSANLPSGSVITNVASVTSDTFDPNLANNESTETTDVGVSADLAITKTGAPNPPVAGEVRTYTIVVDNNGPSDATSVQVNDIVPPVILNPVFSTDNGGTWNLWTSPHVHGPLAAGGSFTLLISGTVNPNLAQNASIVNTASVSSAVPDPDLSNNTATDTSSVNAESDLSIEKIQIDPAALPVISEVNPSVITAGTTIYYYLEVLNNGPSFAVNLLISDIVPAGITNVQYSLNFGNSWQVWSGTRTLPVFSYPGANYILIRGEVDPSLTGTLENTGTVASDTADPDLSNNESTVITTIEQSADLILTKEETIAPVVIGGSIQYEIVVTNDGPSDAVDVSIEDIIDPAIISGAEYTLDGITWLPAWSGIQSIGGLAEGASVTLGIRGTVVDASPDPNVDPIPNTATVSATTPDPDLENNTQTIETPLNAEADVSIVKTGPVSVVAGEWIEYTLEVKNNSGTFDSLGVEIQDNIDADFIDLEEYSTDGGGSWTPWTGSLSIGTLAAQDTFTLLLRGQVLSDVVDDVPNTAQVSSDTPDPNLGNNTSSVVTPLELSADIEVVKIQIDPAILPLDPVNLPADPYDLAIDPASISAGGEIYYVLVYSNQGPSDATNYIITDPLPGTIVNVEASRCQAGFSPWPGSFNAGTVVAGGRCIIIIRGNVVSGATGTLVNTASVASEVPDPDLTNNESTFTTALDNNADLLITKTGAPNPVIAGQTLTYTISVSNLGPADAQAIEVTDVVPASVLVPEISTDGGGTWNAWTGSVPLGVLTVGSSVSFLIRGAVAPAAAQGSQIANTATVDAETADPVPGNNSATAVTNVTALADLAVLKTATPEPVTPGQSLTYTITVQNLGPSNAVNATVADILPAGIAPVSVVPSVGTWNAPLWSIGTLASGASQTLVITATVLELGDGSTITNIATVSSATLDPQLANNSSTAVSTVSASPALSIDKAILSGSPYSAVNDVVEYRYTITNSGDVPLAGPFTVVDDVLGTLTDCAAGPLLPDESAVCTAQHIVSQADLDNGSIFNTAYASGFYATQMVNSQPDSATALGVGNPGLLVTKTASPSTYSAVDEVITYTIVVENTGNVTLSDVNVTDPLTGLNETIVSLAPGASETYTPTYAITQADLDAGSVVNTASAAGVAPNEEPVTGSDSATVTGSQQPGLLVTKTASPESYSAVDEVITYTIVVENTGNVTLSDVNVTDPLTGLNETIVSLAPGASETYTPSYAITQADLDAGSVVNTASAAGVAPNEEPVTGSDSATITGSQQPGLLVTKTASPETYSAVDEVITYTIVVENTGNVTLYNIAVTDPLTGLNEVIASLAPGASETYTPTYAITQADLDAGSVVNTAFAAGVAPNEDPVTGSDSATITGSQQPGLLVTKTASPATFSAVGEVITYTIVVENTGNVTLYNVAVTDPLTGLNEVIASLAPGASETYTQTYTITQADLDTGSVVNTAEASGVGPNEEEISESDDETVTAVQQPGLVVTKTASPGTYSAVGEVITYTIVVENTGNVTLLNIAVADPLTGLNAAIASLAPGASETYTQTYTITQGDLDAGSVVNTASATGMDPNEDPVTDDDSETVAGEQSPGLVVTKTASPATFSAVGEVITYTIVVENTGNVTLSNISVTDPLTGLNETLASLAPGASETYTQTYSITQGDLDAGSVVNTASATGTDPNEDPLTDDDSETVTGEQSPGLAVTKTASPATYSAVGEVITYTIVVENMGNVTLLNIAVADPLTGLNATIASLAPGASETYTQTYTITQGDLDAGSVVNTASATGTDPNEDTVTDDDSETVTGEQSPGLAVTKTASPATFSAVGEVITYTIVVENTGNVTVSNVTVTDPLTGLNATIASLAPGASETYTQTYTITQGDLDAGSVVNTASATGTDPNEDPVTDDDSETVTGEQSPGLVVTKTASPATFSAVGEVITYTIVVENTGNVTVSNISVTDPLTGLNATIASLAPGASETYTQTYSITQADLDAGSVVNTVSVSGDGPGEDPVTDDDEETVTAEQSPVVVVTKSASPEVYSAVDEVITYTIVVENTGNVTVSNVTVTDPLTGLDTTIASLAPGASETYTQTYTITQADLDAGSVVNIAAASFTHGSQTNEATDTATVTAQEAEEDCCSGFNLFDPANLFLGGLALLALLLVSLFTGGDVLSKI